MITDNKKMLDYQEKKIKCQLKIKSELNIVNDHLSIVLAEFSKHVGALHLGSITEYKDLVRMKLRLEHIIKKCNKRIILTTIERI